jgi:hypothetical protein
VYKIRHNFPSLGMWVVDHPGFDWKDKEGHTYLETTNSIDKSIEVEPDRGSILGVENLDSVPQRQLFLEVQNKDLFNRKEWG